MQTKAHKLTEKWKLFTRTQRSGKQGVYVTETEKGRERSMLNKKTKKKNKNERTIPQKKSKQNQQKEKRTLYYNFLLLLLWILQYVSTTYRT